MVSEDQAQDSSKEAIETEEAVNQIKNKQEKQPSLRMPAVPGTQRDGE